MRRFRSLHPEAPILVAVTGTDIYGDFDRAEVHATLVAADRIIVLQPRTIDDLAPEFRSKARVIFQSAEPPDGPRNLRDDSFDVCVVGHLRPVKDPFRLADAVRLLPTDSRVRVLQLGQALSPDMAELAKREMAANPRYEWIGNLNRADCLAAMSRCRLSVLTSLSEGGPAAIAEAIVAGVPMLATRVSGCIGMLGADYPGLFEPGDTTGLAELLLRVEREPAFQQELQTACDRRRPLFHPDAESAAWQALLSEVMPRV